MRVERVANGGAKNTFPRPRISLSKPTPASLPLSIGNVLFHIKVEDPALYARAKQRYAPFLAARAEGFPIFVTKDSGDGDAVAAWRYSWQGASLRLEPTCARFFGIEHEQTLDSLLRILLSQLLVEQSGLLLHAATIVRAGHAFLFLGRSGAGKSTLARLSPSGSVLTDEVSLVRLGANGVEAYGTPFWGEFRSAGQNRRVRVAALYELMHAAANKVSELSRREQLTALLANTLFFANEPPARAQLLELALDLITRLPIRRLQFRPESDFWKAVTP